MRRTYKCISNIGSDDKINNITTGRNYSFFMENENFGYTYDDFDKLLWEFFPDPAFGWEEVKRKLSHIAVSSTKWKIGLILLQLTKAVIFTDMRISQSKMGMSMPGLIKRVGNGA